MLESANGLFHLPRMNYDFWRTPVSGCFTKYHFGERGNWSQGHCFDLLLLYEAAKDRDVVSISLLDLSLVRVEGKDGSPVTQSLHSIYFSL